MSHKPVRILFVCLGNICRSPLAEVIARAYVEEHPLPFPVDIESAGTGNWHIGGGADPRSFETAAAHGLSLSDHCAQQITVRNVQNWDWFIAMDHENRLNLLAMGVPSSRLLMMRQFESHQGRVEAVPDPYYGGDDGFEKVYHMLEQNMPPLMAHIAAHQSASSKKG